MAANKECSRDKLLELKDISKVYGNGVYANKNIFFSVREGEVHALVGENGAGKSTLMNILFGMEMPSHGEIYYKGKRVEFKSPQDAIALGIGMVHQHFKLAESLSITDNIIMGYEPMKGIIIDYGAARKRVLELCKLYGLQCDPEQPVSELSVGDKQKVEIIKALYRGAKLLILDEPTAVLTPQETEEMFVKINELKAKGYTFIFISHKLHEVKEISDRISVIRKGCLIDTIDTKEVDEQQISALVMGSSEGLVSLDKSECKPGKTILRAKSLSYGKPGNKKLVDNVTFTVRAGEIVGIAAVNGNGQNELIEMIAGLKSISEGELDILGTRVNGMSVLKRRKLGLSYIPSDRLQVGLAQAMPIKDNIIASKLDDKKFYKNGLLDNTSITKYSEQLIDDYKIKCDSPSTLVRMLSGGNMQKIVAAREFTQGAKLILCEHPTRGIDIGAARLIHERLLELRDADCAILLVSADMDELFQLSDSLMVMFGGRVTAYFKDIAGVTQTELGNYMLGAKQQTEAEMKEAYYED